MKKGYVALSSVLVIAAVVVVIGVTVSLLSISEAQMSLASKKGHESLLLTDGCVEEVLLYLNKRGILPSTVTTPHGNCGVTQNSQTGMQWTFTVNGSFEGYHKKIQVTATRDSVVYINSWKEVD
jgi:hypothetical protein